MAKKAARRKKAAAVEAPEGSVFIRFVRDASKYEGPPHQVGDVVCVSEASAKRWIRRHAAVMVDPPAAAAAPEPVVNVVEPEPAGDAGETDGEPTQSDA